MLPIKFGVSWPLGSGEKAKNKFLRWQPWWLSWISNQNDLSYFDLLVTPMLPIKFQDNRPFVSEEVKKRTFNMVAILNFPSQKILAIFYQQVTSMLPTNFHVNWPFSSAEEAKDRF